MKSNQDFAAQTPYSAPGRHAELVLSLPTDPQELSAVARNVIVHYRASGHELPDATRGDINTRWLEGTLDLDQQRHSRPLAEPRDPIGRVQGCCRDHTLFCVGVLRAHGIPARSRVGFAGYFVDGWHHDHVIVEADLGHGWRRFDPEIEDARPGLAKPMEIEFDNTEGRGFVTAAQVWSAHRRGEIDPDSYGVDPNVPVLRGERFLFNEVILEVAHHLGDELLLWDSWGRMGPPDAPVSETDADWIDNVSKLLLESDRGNDEADAVLRDMYESDEGLRPGSRILQASPFGDPPIEVDLGSGWGQS